MKKCLFLMLVLISSVSVIGQDRPFQCDTVIQAKGKSVAEIYASVKVWVATVFNSANDVIQMDDAQNGIMICKGRFHYKAPGGVNLRSMSGYVDYTMKVQVREGRYKVTIGDFIHQSTSTQFTSSWSFGLIYDREEYTGGGDRRKKKVWPDLLRNCKIQCKSLVEGISGATAGGGLFDTDDDW